jgi:threonine/homoserine efflux transporter RhtA
MNAVSVALVLASGMMHAAWNLYAKRCGHKAAFLFWAQTVAVVAFLPIGLLHA